MDRSEAAVNATAGVEAEIEQQGGDPMASEGSMRQRPSSAPFVPLPGLSCST
jgi:hypothetical protein